VFVQSSFYGSLDKSIIFHGFRGWMFLSVLKYEDENVTNKNYLVEEDSQRNLWVQIP
jgi:hypothetical protein